MTISLRHMLVLVCGVGAFGSQVSAHSYQECYDLHYQSCIHVSPDDPSNNCHYQALNYCSNHSHGGGGGVPMLDLDFAIEEQDGIYRAITIFDTTALDQRQQELMKQSLAADVEARKAKHKQVMSRMRMLIEAQSEDDY
jgi:hypothetical protein